MVLHAKEIMSQKEVGVICFLEIMTKEVTRITGMAVKLGYTKNCMVKPLGFVGGLLFLETRRLQFYYGEPFDLSHPQ